TIKGTSGIFPKFTPISSMTLSAVNFMDRVRGDEIPLTREMIDLFLNALDLVGDWLDCIRETGAPPEDAEKLSREIQTRFDALAAKT
ncbi:MAG: hypothetical protein GY859_25900, partial [Desulfobacterales bacterium]|nr:hypothetical protein [Desulfobacterales bacterium]